MDRNSTLNADVECGGTQVVAHAGLHALGRFADRVGLGPALSSAIPWLGERAPERDRGVVLTHAMLMLAAGGEACSDIEFFASQSRLFGPVASDSTPVSHDPQHHPDSVDRPGDRGGVSARRHVAADGRDVRDRDGGVGHRCVVDPDPLREQARDGPDLQGRVRVPPAALFRRRDRRGTRRDAAPGQRRREHGHRSPERPRRSCRPGARPDRCRPPSRRPRITCRARGAGPYRFRRVHPRVRARMPGPQHRVRCRRPFQRQHPCRDQPDHHHYRPPLATRPPGQR